MKQEAPASVGLSAELVSIKDAFATAQVAAKKTNEQLSALKQNHDTLGGSMLAGLNKAQVVCKEKKDALGKQAETVENNLGQIRLTEVERAGKLSSEQYASSARVHEVGAALR